MVLIKVVNINSKTPFILFYKDECPFSNFHRTPFKANINETEVAHFSCSEQYFMYHKALFANDLSAGKRILELENPLKMKLEGRGLKMTREDLNRWSEESYNVMKEALFHKFSQNSDIRRHLFRGKGMEFVEASPTDRIWGIGLGVTDIKAEDKNNWRGQNKLGQILDEVRDELWDKTEFCEEKIEIEKESIEDRITKLTMIS